MKIVECPRDAMQGIKEYIPAAKKAAYINSLLKAGFDTIDFGSFVSPKAIPQLRDTAEVLSMLDLSNTSSRLLAIVANQRGAEEAVAFDEIKYLGFPFSISETFQLRNTNSTIEQSLVTVQTVQDLCLKRGKELVVYVSMGFGNPYGDEWNADIVCKWVDRLAGMGITILALSDTIGTSEPESITYLFSRLIPEFRGVEFGAHLHTTPETAEEKVDAAYRSGCRRFDTAVKGYGGCPMAKDDLVGNMPTEKLLAYAGRKGIATGIDTAAFETAMEKALYTFPASH
jgi:hydroxymethylglutaryl-CoA lyase